MHSNLSEKLIETHTLRKNIENRGNRIYSNIFKIIATKQTRIKMSPRLGRLTCYSCSSVIKIDTKTIFIYRRNDVKVKVKTKSDQR